MIIKHTVNTLRFKECFPSLPNSKIIQKLITICLPQFVIFNAHNTQCRQPVLLHCGP